MLYALVLTGCTGSGHHSMMLYALVLTGLSAAAATNASTIGGWSCTRDDCPKEGENTLAPGGGKGSGTYIYKLHGGIPVISTATVKFTKEDLSTGSEPTESVRKYARSLGEDHDDAGHIFANHLGGLAVPINIFPQNPHINRGVWEHFESKIFDCVNGASKATSGATLHWTFTYGHVHDTRPSAMSYKAAFDEGCDNLEQNFENPHDGDADLII